MTYLSKAYSIPRKLSGNRKAATAVRNHLPFDSLI
jgi:hypothetical protein